MFPFLPFTIILLSHPSFSLGHHCYPTHEVPCPPFNTTPPYPFSTSPGCGHPSFHLHCSSPYSTLIINNLSFILLHYEPSSSSITITLSPHQQPHSQPFLCSDLYNNIPTHPISLLGSPFRVSDSSCSRIDLVKPCPPRTLSLPNCTQCPWHCSLVKNPSRLLSDCGSRDRDSFSEQGCQNDVLLFLDQFLEMGIQLEWDEVDDEYFTKCRSCQFDKNGVCGFDSNDRNKRFLCYYNESKKIHHRRRVTALSSILVLACLVCFLSATYLLLRKRNMVDNINPEDPTTLFLHRHRSASLLPPVFTYEELEASTNRFDPKRKIGDGGFGSVYLGQLYDGRIVAVKYLHRHQAHHSLTAISNKSFCNEILILSSIQHANLVKLHGYCSDPRGLLLVYDYIPNGTLADHLHGSTRKKGLLNWQTRVDIALQIATAMEYIHLAVHPPVVHRDITTSNIFVDEHLRVRVGDFGLSRLLICSDPKLSGELNGSSSGCVWTGPQGTPGYLDPDYNRSFLLTEKSDIYSFGVVLLELITGMKAVDQRREKREVALVDMVVSRIQLGVLDQVVDPTLVAEGDVVVENVAAVAELAFRCVAVEKDDRPDAREVVVELRRIWSRARGVKGSNSNVVVVPTVSSES